MSAHGIVSNTWQNDCSKVVNKLKSMVAKNNANSSLSEDDQSGVVEKQFNGKNNLWEHYKNLAHLKTRKICSKSTSRTSESLSDQMGYAVFVNSCNKFLIRSDKRHGKK